MTLVTCSLNSMFVSIVSYGLVRNNVAACPRLVFSRLIRVSCLSQRFSTSITSSIGLNEYVCSMNSLSCTGTGNSSPSTNASMSFRSASHKLGVTVLTIAVEEEAEAVLIAFASVPGVLEGLSLRALLED